MLKKLSELKPGDRFIWADAKTRNCMIATPGGCRGGIMFLQAIDTESELILFSHAHGVNNFSYGPTHQAYVLDDGLDTVLDIPFTTMCAACGKEYAHHRGIRCLNDSWDEVGTIFAPDQEYAIQEDWLATELGLT